MFNGVKVDFINKLIVSINSMYKFLGFMGSDSVKKAPVGSEDSSISNTMNTTK